MWALKRRDENRKIAAFHTFELNENRLLAAEDALGCSANNEKLREELTAKFNFYQDMLILWHPLYQGAKTISALQDEFESVIARIERGGDLYSILNSKKFQKTSGSELNEHKRRLSDMHNNTVRRRTRGVDTGPGTVRRNPALTSSWYSHNVLR
jgi:hypothetical protein